MKSIIQSVLGESFQMRMVRIRDKTRIEPTILVFDAKYPWCIVSLTRNKGCIDVGDECWRQNVMMTTLERHRDRPMMKLINTMKKRQYIHAVTW